MKLIDFCINFNKNNGPVCRGHFVIAFEETEVAGEVFDELNLVRANKAAFFLTSGSHVMAIP